MIIISSIVSWLLNIVFSDGMGWWKMDSKMACGREFILILIRQVRDILPIESGILI